MNIFVLRVTSWVLALFGFVLPLRAASIVITNGTDAELRAAVATCGTVIFNFDGVITLTNSIPISCAVTIDANGHSVVLDAQNGSRIFDVQSNASLTLVHLTLANGRSARGGAISNSGVLSASDCRFLNNTAIGVAGINGTNGPNGTNGSNCQTITPGLQGGRGGDGEGATGGAILNHGSVTLFGCHFFGNAASGGAGGNGGRGGDGGQYPVFPRPTCGADGAPGGAGGDGGEARGGSIANFGDLRVNACTFSNSIAIGGNGGAGGWGGGHGSLPLQASGGAGGMGEAAMGGAIYSTGNTFISNTLFAANSARGGIGGDGGAVPYGAGTNGGAANAGTIYAGGDCIIINCTLVANTARGGNGGVGNGGRNGGNGGDAIGGGIVSDGSVLAVNLTLSENATIAGLGGTNQFSPLYLGTNGNSYGGSIAHTTGVFQIVNSILSGGFSNNCYGNITDFGHNLSSDSTPAWTSGTSMNNTDPMLLPLANNGGITLTMALLPGSPALNNADPAASPAADQRGFARPRGSGFDIGAFEGPDTPSLFIQRGGSSTHTLRWMALSGQSYRVDASSNLVNWTPFSTNTVSTNGQFSFPVPANSSPRFFRLFAQ